MNSTIFISLFTALMAALLVAAIFGYIRPRPSVPTGVLPVRRRFIVTNLEQDLAEAGIEMSAGRYIAYSVLLGLFLSLFIELVFHLEILALFIGLGVGVFGMRTFYVNRIATKMRRTQMKHIIVACRNIAALIEADNSADAALELFASQATNKGVESLTRERNQIAEAIALALVNRSTKGLSLSDSLRQSADRLGNRHYRGMIEVYIRNERLDKHQVAKSLLFYAEGVNYILVLRRSLAQVMGLPLASYKGMGILCPALGIYMIFNLDTASIFWLSWTGQAVALFLFGYWYIGYWLQQRPLNERD